MDELNLEEYKTELEDCLYFGPWDECNPEKAMMLIRMSELELKDSDLAELYCCYVHSCFHNSVEYGCHTKDYYEKAMSVFDKLIELLDRQETDVAYQSIIEKVEKIIELASQATDWASGYDDYLCEKWWSCKWYDLDDED
ncbi:MAG: hypothetical protein Q4A32_01535 [Lachnospiraceae bacterium]|nr:hypothetical protein [Lachnospiraceae bacterium]